MADEDASWEAAENSWSHVDMASWLCFSGYPGSLGMARGERLSNPTCYGYIHVLLIKANSTILYMLYKIWRECRNTSSLSEMTSTCCQRLRTRRWSWRLPSRGLWESRGYVVFTCLHDMASRLWFSSFPGSLGTAHDKRFSNPTCYGYICVLLIKTNSMILHMLYKIWREYRNIRACHQR